MSDSEGPETQIQQQYVRPKEDKEMVKYIEGLESFYYDDKGNVIDGDIPSEWKKEYPDITGKDVKLSNLDNKRDERVVNIMSFDRLLTKINNDDFKNGMADLEKYEALDMLFNLRKTASKGPTRDRKLIITTISEQTSRLQRPQEEERLGFLGKIKRVFGGR